LSAAHLDYDTLAELAEGLLPESQAASADAHLAGCAECRTKSAEIADVTRLLADARVPPMPAELASRIDEALAEAAAASGPVVSLDSRRGRRRAWVLSAAAAVVVVVGGGALVGHALLTGSVSSENGTAQSQAVQDRTGSAAARPPRASALQAPAGAAGSGGAYLTTRSGTDYTAAKLGTQVGERLSRADGRSAEELAPEPLAGCVRRVTGGRMPLIVDVARYEGRPATVIVLPGDASDRLDVWVVGPACSPSNPAVIKHARATR
jgi:anti-sigma factor RsiW